MKTYIIEFGMEDTDLYIRGLEKKNGDFIYNNESLPNIPFLIKLGVSLLSLAFPEELPNETIKNEPDNGFVYLIQANNGAYKIGRTKDLNGRFAKFEVTLPYEIKLIHTIEDDNPNKLERYFHKRFADKRLNGEWFKLSDDDVEIFKGYKVSPQ